MPIYSKAREAITILANRGEIEKLKKLEELVAMKILEHETMVSY